MNERTQDKPWPLQGNVGLDLQRLVELYKASLREKGDENALTVTAEAIASESTALANPAAEAAAFISAQAISELARKK